MKTKIGRRAKSALAILLTLCMVFSVFTVGIASVGAATVDDESVGATTVRVEWDTQSKHESWYHLNNETVMTKHSGDFYSTTLTLNANTTYGMYIYVDGTYYRTSATLSTDKPQSLANKGSNNYGGTADRAQYATGASTKYTVVWDNTNKEITVFPENETFVLTWVDTNGTNTYDEYFDLPQKSTMTTVNNVGTVTLDNYTAKKHYMFVKVGDNYFRAGNTLTTDGSVTLAYKGSNNFGGTSDKTNHTPATAGNYKFTWDNITKSLSVSLATTPLPKPTWSSSTVATNAGTAATLTLSNHSTISAQDSGVTYVLKKGSATLTSPTDYTFDNSTGVFTLNDTTTAAAGSYTVQAIAANTDTYSNSAVSEPATVTVYEPLYSLSGNDLNEGAFTINGNVPSLTNPTGSNTWFNTYQANAAINGATATPGVYKLTFTVKEDFSGSPDISIAQSGNTQRAFKLNGDDYNIATHGDITITDAGIKDADNLYLNKVSTPAGGSLRLKKGQTYTITIDQTQRYNNDSSYPYGKITITTTDVFADVAAKKKAFNATNGEYADVADAESSIGTASAQPVHHAGSLTTKLTAVVANNNYEFVGWYNDAACTGTPAIAASDCTNSGNTYTKDDVTINATTEYYALFKQIEPNDYTVKLSQPSAGTISLTGGVHNVGTDTKAYQGATVSLNATVSDNSKEFSHWVITSDASSADITGTFCANPTQAITTFTMPAQNVTVTAIYSNKTAVTITTSSNNTALGTATYTTGTYYVGDDIPITATNDGGVFSRWVVTGGTVENANSATTTIKATGATVTARAVFDYKTYQLYYNGKYYPLIRQDNGTYVSSFKIPKNSLNFTVYNASDKKYAVSGDGGTWKFNAGTRSATIYNKPEVDDNAWASSVGKQYQNTSDGAAAYMVFYPPGSKVDNTTYGNGRISLVTDNPMGTIAQIYAKDGSIRYRNGDNASPTSSDLLWDDPDWAKPDTATDHRGKMTCLKGTTVITAINSTSVTDADSKRYAGTYKNGSSTVNTPEHLKIYSAPIGSTITIKTTVNDTYKEQGFYVGMFVVNGWKVAATDAGKGVYTATYTLTDETAVNNLATLGGQKSFEITPVYYNKNFEYITFYVDADSVPSEWGNTISTCTDYNGAYYPHFEGSYPGQPLGREGDLYEIKVSKYYYDYSSSTGKWTVHKNYHPSATITAYNYDSVHHYYYVYADELVNSNNNKNLQTYDYSDFAYLAQIENVEAILFRCKKETAHSSWQIYDKADNATGDNYANTNAKEPKWYYVDNKLDSFNKWQVLTDYYGNPIDALGNRILKSGSTTEYYTAEDAKSLTYTKDDTNQIRIVSYGNRNTNDDSALSRTAAKWATGWAVYSGGSENGHNYQIAYGTPADFICTTPGTDNTSSVHYLQSKNSSALKGKLTFITYDKERTNKIANVGDTGRRIDGQWYYSAQHDFDSTVQVHITRADGTALTSSDTFVDEDSSESGTNDGWEGTDSKTVATLDGKTTETYHNVTTEAALNCTPGSGYTFVGWYIYDGTNYTKIHDNFADHNTTMLMKKNYTIVAVVRKVGAGDLVITHSRYTGSKPDAHDGTGKYYVSAVLNAGTASEVKYAEVQNSLTITGLKATDKLTITIHTVCNGADTFYAWYEEALGENYSRTGNYYEICSEDVDPLGETDVSYTFFEADCSTFFDGSTLKRNTIDLYSDIVHVSAYATLTYKYYDRFEENGKNQMVSYVVRNVPLDDDEITNGYIPSDEKITKYAPNVVDTIYTDTKWTIVGTKVERAASNVTLMATQTPKTCYVLHMEHPESFLFDNDDTEISVQNAMGAGWSSRFVPFNSWLIDKNASADNWDPSDFYVTAPQTIIRGTTTWTFDKFEVYAFDRFTGNVGDLIYSSNDDIFGYRIYADCVIYPVYSKNGKTTSLTAKVEPAVLNREVYGESTSFIDRLYADLLISYINIASVTGAKLPEVIRDNKPADTGYTIETGVILDKKVELKDTDFATLKYAAENGGDDTTKSIISGYTGFTDVSVVKSFAQTATAAEGESVKGSGESETLTKYVNKNADLTNKNRLDKVFTYTNTDKAQKRIFAAYSYVVIRNNNGDVIAYAVSDPQLFNFCFTGNKPLATVPA